MVDSILTNQAPIAQKPAENRSVTSTAVANASTVPEIDLAEDVIDVTPRTMDIDPESSFSEAGSPNLRPPLENTITSGGDLRPPLENFRPMELTSERALENRVADIEIRDNNQLDETDTSVRVNNSAIEAFTSTDAQLQQSVDLSA